MTRLNIAIVGCGWVADWHVRDGLAKIPERFVLSACCDIDSAKRNAFAARYGIPDAVESFADLLARRDIDAVIIATPPSSHFEMVTAALRAGKHVICEKPLTSSLALADAMAEAEKRSSARVMPIFQCRFGKGIA
jgi:predicted dehydrogenase